MASCFFGSRWRFLVFFLGSLFLLLGFSPGFSASCLGAAFCFGPVFLPLPFPFLGGLAVGAAAGAVFAHGKYVLDSLGFFFLAGCFAHIACV